MTIKEIFMPKDQIKNQEKIEEEKKEKKVKIDVSKIQKEIDITYDDDIK